jgi:hypothetical protein
MSLTQRSALRYLPYTLRLGISRCICTCTTYLCVHEHSSFKCLYSCRLVLPSRPYMGMGLTWSSSIKKTEPIGGLEMSSWYTSVPRCWQSRFQWEGEVHQAGVFSRQRKGNQTVRASISYPQAESEMRFQVCFEAPWRLSSLLRQCIWVFPSSFFSSTRSTDGYRRHLRCLFVSTPQID